MFISKIEPIGNKRYLIYIDQRIAFVLYKGDLRMYGLNEGASLTEAVYNTIIEDTLKKRAFNRLIHLLEKKDYSECQLVRKLHDAYYPEGAIEYSISKVKEYGYVDDARYARRYIECYLESRSKRRIIQDLYSKGINKDVINQAFDEAQEDGIVQNEEQLIRGILEKRHYYTSDKSQKERAKQYTYLAGKGFSSGAIRKALELDITWQ